MDNSLKPLSRSMEPPLPSQHPHRSSFHGSGSMKPKGKQEWDSKEQVKRYSSGKVPPMSHIPRNGNSIEDDLGEAAYRAKKASEERIALLKEDASNHYIESFFVSEPPILSKEETNERIEFWRKMSAVRRFDPDTHIVDPLAHYAYIDYLEEFILHSSEFYHCKGIYGDSNDELGGWSKETNSFAFVPPWIWNLLPGSLVQPTATIAVRYATLRNLWKSYLILCRVINSFTVLQRALFCGEFYSVLVEHPTEHVAELVEIRLSQLHELRTGIESTISLVFSGALSSDSETTARAIRTSLCASNEILSSLHFPQHTHSSAPSLGHTLLMCRIVVLLLDLGMVSYIGSHGSPFGTYVQSDAESIEFQDHTVAASYGFSCNLRSLACLEGFLDTRVWVFRSNEKHSNLKGDDNLAKWEVLTKMNLFADVWGPVWAVPAPNRADEVREYILSRGRITFLTGDSNIEGTILCHWSPIIDPTVENNFGTTSSSLYISPQSVLLIGASLRESPNCIYKLRHYEEDYGDSMGFLGTIPEAWRLDERQLGLSLGQYGVLNVAGTQKRLPGVSLKEHIWNKFNLSPQTASIEWLNNLMGVEISHCTGNARRIRLKDMLRLKQVRERLHHCHPNWEQTGWGEAFSTALEADTFGPMRRLWDEHFEMRGDIAKLVSNILQILHHTGEKGDNLIAAYLNRGVDKQVLLKVRGNDWARCLRDSDRMATYAVVGDTCLQCSTAITVPCRQTRAPTVLQTEIRFGRELPEEGGDVWLVPGGIALRIVGDINDIEKEIKLVPTTSILRPRVRATQVIESTGRGRRSRRVYSATIMSSTRSYGGMSEKRQAIEPRRGAGQRGGSVPQAVNAPARTNRGHQHSRKSQISSGCCIIL